MQYCHEREIYHLDLKPENILLENNYNNVKVKITDFGMNTYLGADKIFKVKKNSVRTVNYNNYYSLIMWHLKLSRNVIVKRVIFGVVEYSCIFY